MTGTASLTVMLTVVDLDPTELFAQIVNTSPETTTVGVPQIVPLLVRSEARMAMLADGPRGHATGRAVGGDGRCDGGDGRTLCP